MQDNNNKPMNEGPDAVQLQRRLDELSSERDLLQKKCKSLETHLQIMEKQRQKWLAQDILMQQVTELSQEVNTLDLDVILTVATEKLPLLVGARYASLYQFDGEKRELVLLKSNHDERLAQTIQLDDNPDSLMARAITDSELLLVQDMDTYEAERGIKFKRPFSNKYKTSSCMICPLKSAGVIIGLLNLADKVDGGVFDDKTDRVPVQQLAEIMGASLSNYRLFIESQRQARTDGLTGMTNHKTFMSELVYELTRVQRYKEPLSLLMMDLDHFKSFNDKYTHQTGDYVLAETARLIRDSIREKIDKPARYGGEEFIAMLPNTNLIGARILAERIRQRIENHRYNFNNEELSVTISIGVTQYNESLSLKEFIDNADSACYLAKRNGRNRVEQWIG